VWDRPYHYAPRIVRSLPRVGRYRLYDLTGKNRLRCRLCGAKLVLDSAWKHWWTERKKERIPGAMEAALAVAMLRRRSTRHHAHARYEHATGGDRARWKR